MSSMSFANEPSGNRVGRIHSINFSTKLFNPDGESSMPIINSQVKPFKATAYKNGDFVQVSDADLKGKWSVVFFYPADFTFVCPTELEDLADNYDAFQKLGVEIYSVSTDTHFAHAAWHNTSPAIGKIQYTMIGDPTHAISRNFDVLIEDAGLTLPSCCAKSRLLSTSLLTQARFAQPSGKKARPLWLRPWTWSARSKSVDRNIRAGFRT
jgi:peroxiredoxin